jgi:hypothetical protein
MNFLLFLICLLFLAQVATNIMIFVVFRKYCKQLKLVNNTNIEDLMNDFKFDTQSEN